MGKTKPIVVYPPVSSLVTSGNKQTTSPLCLGERDFAILWDTYVANPVSTEQISVLHFQPTASNAVSAIKSAQRRLRALVQQGYLQRQSHRKQAQKGRYQHIYTLTERGAKVLCQHFGIEPGAIEVKRKRDETIFQVATHNLAATSVRIAVKLACEHANHTVLETWFYDRELRIEGMTGIGQHSSVTGKTKSIPLIPDALFVLKQDQRTCVCFVEIDTGSTTVEHNALEKKSWVTKTIGYANFFLSEQYRQRYRVYFANLPAIGIPPARVLVVTPSERRLHNLIETTRRTLLAAGADHLCSWMWFTTTDLATDAQQVLSAPIWHTAALGNPLPLLPQE